MSKKISKEKCEDIGGKVDEEKNACVVSEKKSLSKCAGKALKRGAITGFGTLNPARGFASGVATLVSCIDEEEKIEIELKY